MDKDMKVIEGAIMVVSGFVLAGLGVCKIKSGKDGTTLKEAIATSIVKIYDGVKFNVRKRIGYSVA